MLEKLTEKPKYLAKIEQISFWVTCKKCLKEWTPQSINKFGLCPRCHNKALGIQTDSDLLDEVLRKMTPEEIANWDGSLETVPQRLQPQIKGILSPKIKDETLQTDLTEKIKRKTKA